MPIYGRTRIYFMGIGLVVYIIAALVEQPLVAAVIGGVAIVGVLSAAAIRASNRRSSSDYKFLP